jgi:hypothetical protein
MPENEQQGQKEKQYTKAEVFQMQKDLKLNVQDVQKNIDEYLKNYKCETCSQMAMMESRFCPFCWFKKRRLWHKEWFWQGILTLLFFGPFNIFAGYKWGTAVQYTTTAFWIGGMIMPGFAKFIAEILNARRK